MFRAVLLAVFITCNNLGSSIGTSVENLDLLPFDEVESSFKDAVDNGLPRIFVFDSDKTLYRQWERGRMGPLLNSLEAHVQAGTTVSICSARPAPTLHAKYGHIKGLEFYGEFGSMKYEPNPKSQLEKEFGIPTFGQTLIPAADIMKDIEQILLKRPYQILIIPTHDDIRKTKTTKSTISITGPKLKNSWPFCSDPDVYMPQRHENANSLCIGYVGVKTNDAARVADVVNDFKNLIDRKYPRRGIKVEHVGYEKIINVRPPTADKGYFVEKMVPHYLQEQKNAFVFVAGDSPPDESMFTKLHELGLPNAWSTVVQEDKEYESNAQHYVDTPEDIQELLRKLLSNGASTS